MKKIQDTNHTFVVCAYKESPYLEECVQSLLGQTIATNICMTTSTPCEFITGIAQKYKIPLIVRIGESDIKEDWNFAYNNAKTDWVTIAHQDDKYDAHYIENFLVSIERYDEPFAFLTDYIPIKNGEIGKRDINSRIRRFLRKPLKYKILSKTKFWRRMILALGNSICCPTVTYNKKVLGMSYFTSDLKFNIDWDTFLKFSTEKGSIAYVEKPLTYYRIHDGATSKEFIDNHERKREDKIMFRKFWPEWVTNIIMMFYKRAYDTYS